MRKKAFTRKRFLSVWLGLMLSFAMGITAFAAETESVPTANATNMALEQVAEPAKSLLGTPTASAGTMSTRAASGYAADYTDYDIGSFTVTVSGSSASRGTAKVTAWDFPSGTQLSISLERPNGSFIYTDLTITTGQSISKSFSNLQPGNYTVHYTVHGAGKGWVNCNIS